MENTIARLLVALSIVPLVTLSSTLTPAMDTKVLIYRGVAFVAWLLFFILLLKSDTRTSVFDTLANAWKSNIFKTMTVSMVLLTVSTVFAYDRYAAFFGTSNRGEGFLTLFSLFILYVLFTLFFDKKQWNRFFIGTAWTSTVIFIIELVQYTRDTSGRPDATLGNPIFLAGFFLFSLFAGTYLYTQKETVQKGKRMTEKRIAPILGSITAVLSVIGILLTKTRGTLVGLAAGIVATLVILLIKGKGMTIGSRSVQKMSGIVLALVLVLGSLFLSTRSAGVWQRIPGLNRLATTNAQNSTSRLIYLQITEKGFVQSNFKEKMIGWGWDNYKFFWDKNYDPKVYFYDPSSTDRAHNRLADQLIMTGVFGLIAYLALWYFFYQKSMQLFKENKAVAIGLIFVGTSYFVHNLFGIDIPVLVCSFYALLALLTTYEYKT